jgi:CheY-like chemotaxis protein
MRVIHAEDGNECLTVLKENTDVDIILMDIMMPGLSGYQIIPIIRDDLQFANTPIIAITAKSMDGERQRCLDAGANDYFCKPVDHEKLISTLQIMLTNS